MKYRILKETTRGGNVRYLVQKKKWFFWYFVHMTYSSNRPLGYNNERAARKYIEDCYTALQIRKNNQVVKIEYLYILLILLSSCTYKYITVGANQNLPHKCKYKLCPYKGLYKPQWNDSVINYTRTKFGDTAHAIDMVHLKKPNWTYEQICKALLIK